MSKRSDLPVREQRELNDMQARLNLAMSSHRKHQALAATAKPAAGAGTKPIASSAIRRPASLPVFHAPEPVAARPLCAAEYFAESTSRIERKEAEGNAITILRR